MYLKIISIIQWRLKMKTNNASYVGLDPSFTGFGIAMIHQDIKEVQFYELTSDLNKNSTVNKFMCIYDLVNTAKHLIRCKSSDFVHIGQEVSTAYSGWFVAELFGLAYGLYNVLYTLQELASYDFFSQEYIKFIHGHKRTKEETIFMIEDQILPIFEKYGYKVIKDKTAMTSTGIKEKNKYIRRETITNNEADAFIYCIREFVKNNQNEPLVEEILKLYPRFNEKNKELK